MEETKNPPQIILTKKNRKRKQKRNLNSIKKRAVKNRKRRAKKMSTVLNKSIASDNDREEPDLLLRACFKIDPSVELKEIPTTGEEYLLKVMTERRKCLVVTKCNVDLSQYASNQSWFIKGPLPAKSAPDILKPTIEWQNIQVADFSDVRLYVAKLQANPTLLPGPVEIVDFDCDKFQWKLFFKKTPPSLMALLSLQPNNLDVPIVVLLDAIAKVNPGETINPTLGQWIYSLLAGLRLPLHSETVSILRDLARICADIRSKINLAEENALELAAPCNLFICLVGRYFRQFDLVDS